MSVTPCRATATVDTMGHAHGGPVSYAMRRRAWTCPLDMMFLFCRRARNVYCEKQVWSRRRALEPFETHARRALLLVAGGRRLVGFWVEAALGGVSSRDCHGRASRRSADATDPRPPLADH